MKYKAKKSLGQNFLKSEKALKQIIKASGIVPTDVILEIGPGTGALTTKLLETGAIVIAIEKDRELIPLLTEKFNTYIENKKLILLEDDILLCDIEKIFKKLKVNNYKLVANIPYYITGAIMRKFFENNHQPTLMTLLVQKEVAERIVSKNNKETLLSLSVKAFGIPKIIAIVPRGAFAPAPGVDSAIITISNINRKNFTNKEHENRFFTYIHLGFAHKRKTLWHNFKEIHREKLFTENTLDQKTRAEDIDIKMWIQITK